jgi:hypothetical protein
VDDRARSRAKDFEDVKDVLAVQREALDQAHIHRGTALHGARGELDAIRASIPPLD